MRASTWVLLLGMVPMPAAFAGATVQALLDEYRSQGAGDFAAERGAQLWNRSFHHERQPAARQCTSCHAGDPRQPGRHARTGKTIAPLAPSRDPRRLSDRARVRKWLKRNCKWTLGRECTAQEKGDVLTYLSNQ